MNVDTCVSPRPRVLEVAAAGTTGVMTRTFRLVQLVGRDAWDSLVITCTVDVMRRLSNAHRASAYHM